MSSTQPTPPYIIASDVLADLPIAPPNGILSRTVIKAPHMRVVEFAFDKGQELTEHTSAYPALLQFIEGQATLVLGGDTVSVHPGTWVYMEPNLPHSVLAITPLVMVLVLMGGG